MNDKPLYRRTATPETKAFWDKVDEQASEAPWWAVLAIEREFGTPLKLVDVEFEAPLLGEPGLYISLGGADISIPTAKYPEKVGHINSAVVKGGKIICKATVRKEFAAKIKELF